MYDIIIRQAAQLGQEKVFLGERHACRFCTDNQPSAFGRKTNAHTFPAALGNRVLFSLDECKSCNEKFSIYEDSLVKVIGPFLTLGGVKGRNGIRNTGHSDAKSTIRNITKDGKRHLAFSSDGNPDDLVHIDPNTGLLRVRMPIDGDKFIPRYAYKALLKMALALLPKHELNQFSKAVNCLKSQNETPHKGRLQVGFSYSYIGNSPPLLVGTLLRRKDDKARIPYLLFVFLAGSVCFQIWVKSDDKDLHIPISCNFGIDFNIHLPKPSGDYHSIHYKNPMQFEWADLSLRQQPFEAFELVFNPQTTEGNLTPIQRQPSN